MSSAPPPQWLPPAATTDPADPFGPPAEPPQPFGEERQPWYRRYLGPLAAAAFLIFKFGKAAILLLPKAKLLTTSASMLVSIGAYSLIWGWKFAAGFVALLLIHECGHAIQMKREGIKVEGMAFIPFLGAAVWAKSLGDNALAEARVGLAGPIVGSLAAAACLPIHAATGDDFWLALAFTGFFLNLFNLLPVVPLDGGRAMAALSPWMWFVGFFGVVLLAFVAPNPIIIIIALFAGFELYHRWKRRKQGGEEQETYYKVAPKHRAMVAIVYLGLIVGLVLGMDATHLERDFDDA